MLQTILNFFQEIGNRMAGLWEAGSKLFQIVDIILNTVTDAFNDAFSSASPTGNALIPSPLIAVCFVSVVIFCIKIIIGSSNG